MNKELSPKKRKKNNDIENVLNNSFFNEIIAKIPSIIPNSFVISSEGCTHKGDRLHFSKQGYKLLVLYEL